jgi:hypothetical protein
MDSSRGGNIDLDASYKEDFSNAGRKAAFFALEA